MNSYLAKYIFSVGAGRRNPSLWSEYEKLKESEWLEKDELIKLQLDRARSFLMFCQKYSPYYRDLFKNCGFSASNFNAIDDLKIIPTITKRELIDYSKSIHTDYSFDKIYIAETSGTTGRALEFRKNERWDSINRANIMRAYDWYDVKPWDRNGYFWGYNTERSQATKTYVLDKLQNRFRIFDYDRNSIKKFAKQLVSARYIGGYSSMIYEVAKIINELNIEKPKLNMVKGTSEMILDVYQAESKKAFGKRITSEYGAAESGLIAFECPEGSMHINIENIITEVDRDGEIIVTNLASYSFPVVRYRLGDIVTLSDDTCKCGRAHPIIKDIVGRRGNSVYGKTGLYPSLTFYYVFKNLAISEGILLNYKAIQRSKGSVELYIEGINNTKYERYIQKELTKYFSEDIIFDIEYLEEFSRKREKAQYFESLL